MDVCWGFGRASNIEDNYLEQGKLKIMDQYTPIREGNDAVYMMHCTMVKNLPDFLTYIYTGIYATI